MAPASCRGVTLHVHSPRSRDAALLTVLCTVHTVHTAEQSPCSWREARPILVDRGAQFPAPDIGRSGRLSYGTTRPGQAQLCQTQKSQHQTDISRRRRLDHGGHHSGPVAAITQDQWWTSASLRAGVSRTCRRGG